MHAKAPTTLGRTTHGFAPRPFEAAHPRARAIDGHHPVSSTARTGLRLGPERDLNEMEAERISQEVTNTVSEPSSTAAPVSRVQQSSAGGTTNVPDAVEAGIESARGKGSALPLNVRIPMERAFGRPFDRVRLHADVQSDQMNRVLGSRAFTAGTNIFVRPAENELSHPDGMTLLAHELTHVVQQTGGAPVVQRLMATIEQGRGKRLNKRVLKGQRRSKSLMGGAKQSVKTKVTFTPGQVQTGAQFEDVGEGMEGVIGPDHPGGTQPQQSAHQAAFDYLKNAYGDYFVRGHLLNGDIGGPGDAFNLYPLTKQANSLHYQNVEKQIKRWVNSDHLYVYYKIDVSHPNALEPLDADFVCEAYPLRNTYPNDRVRATNGGLIQQTISSRAATQSGSVTPTTADYSLGTDALKEPNAGITNSIEYQVGKLPKGYVPLADAKLAAVRKILTDGDANRAEHLLNVRLGLGEESIEKLVMFINDAIQPRDVEKSTWNRFANAINAADFDPIVKELEEGVKTRSRKIKAPNRFSSAAIPGRRRK